MGVGQEARVGEGIKCKGPEVQPLILLPALSQVYSVGAGFPAPLCLLMCTGGRSPGLGFPYGGNQNDDTERPLP